MTNLHNQSRATAFTLTTALAAFTFISVVPLAANGQENRSRSGQAERTTWAPTRSAPSRTTQKHTQSDSDAAPIRDPEPYVSQKRRVSAPAPRQNTQRSNVRQASHQIPSPPPSAETIQYAGSVYDGSCDAFGGPCGCGAGGCDGIACGGCDSLGSCGPNCGCSLCGEVPSGRAWRPALTLSLPQDGWFSIEALHMAADGIDLPPLVTTSPVGTAQADAGVLNHPNTTVLYGGDDILNDRFDGGRLRFGFWFDRCHTFGIGAEYIGLDKQSETYTASSTGTPILARPFFNTATGQHDAELVAFPGVVAGTVSVRSYSELKGGSIYLRRLRGCDEGCREWLFCGCNGHYCTRSEVRFGFRSMELTEGVAISEELVGINPASTFNIGDSFNTRNQFNGFDLGWYRRLTRGYWTLDGLVRLGFGNTRQSVSVRGNTQSIDQSTPGNQEPESFGEGILALESNIGEYSRDEFSVLPEINLTIGYQLTNHLTASIGYTGIYWSNVVRPGHHIPTGTNPEYFPPALENPTTDAQPQFSYDTTDYWVHGLNYGLEYRW